MIYTKYRCPKCGSARAYRPVYLSLNPTGRGVGHRNYVAAHDAMRDEEPDDEAGCTDCDHTATVADFVDGEASYPTDRERHYQ